jgi:hypothetical protein
MASALATITGVHPTRVVETSVVGESRPYIEETATPDSGSVLYVCTDAHGEALCNKINGLHAGLKHYSARKRTEPQNELTPVLTPAVGKTANAP